MKPPNSPPSRRYTYVVPFGASGWGYFSAYMFYFWAAPFIPVDQEFVQQAGDGLLYGKLVSRFVVWRARRRHAKQDEALSQELCRDMDDVEANEEWCRINAIAPEGHLAKVRARQHYAAALRKIALLLRQRDDISGHLSTRHAIEYMHVLNDHLNDTTVEAVFARTDAEIKGVRIEGVEQQYGDYVADA